jgi:GntR family transcriptional repressor for pyruvate dehydrogenase complex
MNLQRIQRALPAHAACEQALRAVILRGDLAPGDRLPPERELAVQLGVSRLTLRAALATLAAAGLVEARHGSGYVVQDYRDGGPGLLPGLVALAEAHGGLLPMAADLLLVRRHLAAALLETFVEQPPTALQVAAVAARVDALEVAATTGASLEALAVADLAVIAALLDAARGSALRLCFNPVVAVVTREPRLRAALYAEPATNVVAYRALLAWLARPRRAELATIVELLRARDAATLARLGRPAKTLSRGKAR